MITKLNGCFFFLFAIGLARLNRKFNFIYFYTHDKHLLYSLRDLAIGTIFLTHFLTLMNPSGTKYRIKSLTFGGFCRVYGNPWHNGLGLHIHSNDHL